MTQFTKLYVCRIYDDDWNQYVVAGRWEGLSAAGPHKSILAASVAAAAGGAGGGAGAGAEGKDGEDITSANLARTMNLTKGQTRGDGDPQWFHNPQFVSHPPMLRAWRAPRLATRPYILTPRTCTQKQRITTTKPATCSISLTQADRKLLGLADNAPIRFVVLRDRRGAKARVWEEYIDDVGAHPTPHPTVPPASLCTFADT